ncbi:hypothetical protein ACFSYD_14810 [Paracoccus aerius]
MISLWQNIKTDIRRSPAKGAVVANMARSLIQIGKPGQDIHAAAIIGVEIGIGRSQPDDMKFRVVYREQWGEQIKPKPGRRRVVGRLHGDLIIRPQQADEVVVCDRQKRDSRNDALQSHKPFFRQGGNIRARSCGWPGHNCHEDHEQDHGKPCGLARPSFHCASATGVAGSVAALSFAAGP